MAPDPNDLEPKAPDPNDPEPKVPDPNDPEPKVPDPNDPEPKVTDPNDPEREKMRRILEWMQNSSSSRKNKIWPYIEPDSFSISTSKPGEMANQEQQRSDYINSKIEGYGKKIQYLESLVKKVQDNATEIERKMLARNFEMLGLFAALLGFLVIQTNIVVKMESFLGAATMIIGLTCCLIVFACVICELTETGRTKNTNKYFFISIGILISLLAIAIFVTVYYNENILYYFKKPTKNLFPL